MAEALLVTGIHREELAFGDRVAALLDSNQIDVMRIPEGIPQNQINKDDRFYYKTRHREIYLQLWQQVVGQYRVLLDLHCGVNDSGRCADIYCQKEGLLECVAARSKEKDLAGQLKTVKIIRALKKDDLAANGRAVQIGAHTLIPDRIWNSPDCTYIGLEIYLSEAGEGVPEDWRFANELIEIIQGCVY